MMAGDVRVAGCVALATALMLSCLPLLVSSAVAAAPANDDFANREVLSGGLPLEVLRWNVEATKEEGEYIPGLTPAGHSIWFEWESESSGWVTIGACDDDFPTILAIFTGTKVSHLTQAASGNAAEGPDCPYQQRQYTFNAQSGTKYVIAVDGNIFHLPEAPTPVTEGEVVLRIEATPTPSNDDFANATTLKAPVEEEPGGERYYLVNTNGYNWGATTEPGEPFYGTGSGASVWYTWTAPESGKYHFNGPCCGGGLNWGLYVGDSVDELTQILAATGSAEAVLTAGMTYRIGVYGTPDLETEEPSMGHFSFLISANLPPLPSPTSSDEAPAQQQIDTAPPDTKIVKRVLKSRLPIFVFRFHSTEAGSTFRCKLDGRPFVPCGSTKIFGHHYGPGRHVLKVAAVDTAGNIDLTPAVARFRISKKPTHNQGHRKGHRRR